VIIRHSARARHPLAQSEGGRPGRGRSEPDDARQGTAKGRLRSIPSRSVDAVASPSSDSQEVLHSCRGLRTRHGRPPRSEGDTAESGCPHACAACRVRKGADDRKEGRPRAGRLRASGGPGGLRVARPLPMSSDGSSLRDGLRVGAEPVTRSGGDHHAKSTTEGHWTWHLQPFPWDRRSFGSRCRSGLLGRRQLAAGGTARKVAGRR